MCCEVNVAVMKRLLSLVGAIFGADSDAMDCGWQENQAGTPCRRQGREGGCGDTSCSPAA